MPQENQTSDASRSIGSENRNPRTAAPSRKTHLLVFAAGAYRNWPELQHPVAECRVLVKVLKEKYGITQEHITVFEDADVSRTNLVTAFFSQLDLGENENLIIIFSGHGHIEMKSSVAYWVPAEAMLPWKTEQPGQPDPVALADYISTGFLLDNLSNARVFHLLLIVDSCFAGKFGRIELSLPASPDGDLNVRPENIPSRWAITSGLIEKTNDESPFADALIRTLAENTRERLSLDGLMAEIEDRLPPGTSQTPAKFDLAGANRRGGQFYLHHRVVADDTPSFISEADGMTGGVFKTVELSALEGALRAGSRAHRENLEKGRFRSNIVESLLPGWKETFLDIKVATGNEEARKTGALLVDAVEAARQTANPHLLVTGEGGSGKTVSLLHLWKTFTTGEQPDDAPLPLFVPLNEYNAAETGKRSDFILRYLAKHYLEQPDLTDLLKKGLYDLFRNPYENHPPFLLLLDGFNEVTAEQTELLIELDALRQRCPGLQIVATSRPDLPVESFTWARDFGKIHLMPVDEARIAAYLAERQLPLPTGADLPELLGNPMMLTLYAGTSDMRAEAARTGDGFFAFKPHISSRGELLWNFAEAQLYKFHRDNPADRDGLLQTAFLLRYLAPFVAYRMVEAGQFYLSVLPEEGLLRFSDLIAEAYAWFERLDLAALLPEYTEKPELFHRLDPNATHQNLEARSLALRAGLVTRLNLLVREGNTLRYQHQHFRDYFAARHVWNDITLSLKADAFPLTMQREPLDFYVRELLGEMEGEHSNKINWNEAAEAWQWSAGQFALDNQLATLLDWCRGKDTGVGYTVWNVLTIYIKARGELTGADLSRLDLRKDNLNNIRLSRPGLVAKLDKAIQWPYNFFPQGHSGGISSAIPSKDGRRIISAAGDGTVKIWDMITGQCLKTFLAHGQGVKSAVLSPDGQRIISASFDGTVKIWDTHSGQCLKTLRAHTSWVNSAVPSPDGQYIISASYDKTVKIWDVRSGRHLKTFQGHTAEVNSVAFSADGQFVISTSNDKTVKIWDVQSGRCLQTLQGHTDRVNSAVMSPSGKQIISTSHDKTVKIWNIQSGQCFKTFHGHTHWVNSAIQSQDGRIIISASSDRTLRIWDVQSGRCLKTLQGHTDEVYSAVPSPGERTIISASYDNTVKIWDAITGQCLKTLHGYAYEVKNAVSSPDGQRIISASRDKTVKIWDVRSGQCLKTLQGHTDAVFNVIQSSDGQRIVSASRDKTIKIWDAQSGGCLHTIQGHINSVNSAIPSIDGRQIISASHDQTVKIWDAQSGQCLKTLQGHADSVSSAVPGIDGSQILSASWDKTIKTWDVQSGLCLLTLQGHKNWVNSAVFSSDGQRILSASNDKTVKIWDTQSGQCLKTLEGHTFSVNSAVPSSDGQKIISASDDHTVKIWDARSGKCLLTLKGHTNWVKSAVASPDGQYIISASHDGTIKIWNAHTGECLRTLPNIPGLLFQGCDLSTVVWEEDGSAPANWKELMETYGAKV